MTLVISNPCDNLNHFEKKGFDRPVKWSVDHFWHFKMIKLHQITDGVCFDFV